MIELRKIRLCDKTEFEKHVPKENIGCESSFVVNFLYAQNFPTYIGNWRGKVAIAKPPNLLYYPVGEFTYARELAEYAKEISDAGFEFEYIYNVPPDYKHKSPDLEKYFYLIENEGEFDYIYAPDSLAQLKGALLRKKRNHIKHFLAENPNWSEEKISQNNFENARSFVENRCVEAEKSSIKSAFENFYDLALDGIVLRDNTKQIVGVAIFAKIGEAIYDVIIEKSDHQKRGASQMLVMLEAQKLLGLGATFINREQDLNLPNLRHAKRSLDPIFMYKRVSLIPKNYERN